MVVTNSSVKFLNKPMFNKPVFNYCWEFILSVKDLRYNIENTNPDKVLDGDIDEFIEGAIFGAKN